MCACVSINIACARGKNSPFDDGAGPGESAAEHDHENVIAMLDSAAAIRFIQRDGNGGCGSVSVLVEIYVEAIERNFQSVGDRLDDAQVRLMGNNARDVVRC